MLIQFDGYSQTGGKLTAMREFGFYFLANGAGTCNSSLVEVSALFDNLINNKNVLQTANDMLDRRKVNTVNSKTYSHWQFELYQAVIELLCKSSVTENFLYRYIFPYAHYLMLTF